MPYPLVSEEEMAMDYAYKMDRLWLKEEVRVEIRWVGALRVIGQKDALTAEARLPTKHKTRVSRATASVNLNGVITVRVPKHDPP
ncbi:hypothetical protein ACJRO7_009688 [Eucalyptus globulus]|uniref:SHSP domain-containing protein n=1 Tax=Eucalyptus globulus TaxID=34317 RepID=A0ABD3L9J5_EUCGL